MFIFEIIRNQTKYKMIVLTRHKQRRLPWLPLLVATLCLGTHLARFLCLLLHFLPLSTVLVLVAAPK